jgi:hypothetical protein
MRRLRAKEPSPPSTESALGDFESVNSVGEREVGEVGWIEAEGAGDDLRRLFGLRQGQERGGVRA